jgi:hypothetical protein
MILRKHLVATLLYGDSDHTHASSGDLTHLYWQQGNHIATEFEGSNMGINAKVIRRGAIAVAAVATAGALGACSATGSITATPVSPGATPTSTSASQATNVNNPASPETTTKDQGQGVANTGGGHPACANMKVSDMSPDLVNGSSSQWRFEIKLINQGSTACTVQGFPGVRLNGSDGTTWDLVRTSEPIKPVLLAPGEFALADLTYLTNDKNSTDGSNGWHVDSFSVTPPNGTNTQTMPWLDSIDLVKQDAATHPGTYVGPAHK